MTMERARAASFITTAEVRSPHDRAMKASRNEDELIWRDEVRSLKVFVD